MAEQASHVLISPLAIAESTAREALGTALSSVLTAARGGPWEASLERTDAIDAPHLWVLRLRCPKRVMIVPVPRHRQTADGVVQTVVDAVSVGEPGFRAS